MKKTRKMLLSAGLGTLVLNLIGMASVNAGAINGWPMVSGGEIANAPSYNHGGLFRLNIACPVGSAMFSDECGEFEESPNVSYNITSEDQMLWGHGGKGTVFVNTDKLINNDPQKRVARAGETIDYSTELVSERYYGTGTSRPVINYIVGVLIFDGLTLDQSSVVVKVGGTVIPADEYESEYTSIPASYREEFGGAKAYYAVRLPWANYTNSGSRYTFQSFKYNNDAKIELSYSATVAENDSLENVSSKGMYGFEYLDGSYMKTGGYVDEDSIKNDNRFATAYLKSNILIRRVDENDNPLPGARYSINGVKATYLEDGLYRYNEAGEVEEYITNDNGEAVILGLPIDEYTVVEVAPPEGYLTKEESITHDLATESTSEVYGEVNYVMNYGPNSVYNNKNITSSVVQLEGGKKAVNTNKMLKSIDPSADTSVISMNYDETSGGTVSYGTASQGNRVTYKAAPSGDTFTMTVTRDGHSEVSTFAYDNVLQKYIAPFSYTIDGAIDESQLEKWSLKINGDSGVLMWSGTSIALTRSDDDGCYDGKDGSYWIRVCEDSTGYQLESGANYAQHYKYDETKGAYYPDYGAVAGYMVTDGLENGRMTFAMYHALTYSEPFGHYYMPGDSTIEIIVSNTRKLSLASEYLFGSAKHEEEVPEEEQGGSTDVVDDEIVLPESIENPQTRDAIVKSLIIMAVAGAPLLAVRRSLRGRTIR